LASSVSGGTWPSGGSITSDVRVVVILVPRSHQKSLYARSTSARVPLARSSSPLVSRARFSSSATSSGVKNSRFPTLAGRSNGVIVRLEYVPCRSGSPHGASGVVQDEGGLPFAVRGVCPAAAAAEDRITAVVPVRVTSTLSVIASSFGPPAGPVTSLTVGG